MEGTGGCKLFQFDIEFINVVCFLFCVSEDETPAFNVCLRIEMPGHGGRQSVKMGLVFSWVELIFSEGVYNVVLIITCKRAQPSLLMLVIVKYCT